MKIGTQSQDSDISARSSIKQTVNRLDTSLITVMIMIIRCYYYRQIPLATETEKDYA